MAPSDGSDLLLLIIFDLVPVGWGTCLTYQDTLSDAELNSLLFRRHEWQPLTVSLGSTFWTTGGLTENKRVGNIVFPPQCRIWCQLFLLRELRSFNVSKDILIAVYKSLLSQSSRTASHAGTPFFLLKTDQNCHRSSVMQPKNQATHRPPCQISTLRPSDGKKKTPSSHKTLHTCATTHSNSSPQAAVTRKEKNSLKKIL